jgi:uncharacterized protein with PIN domain
LSAVGWPRWMSEPCWLVDEMLGRLARYIRFLGYDAEYVKDLDDNEIARRATSEGRRLITRDRDLAARLPDAILLTRTDLPGQWRELRESYPDLRAEVRFERCSICNGELSQIPVPQDQDRVAGLPPGVRTGVSPLFACVRCGHLYWEGSHTQSVRERLAKWSRPQAPAE